MVAAREASVSVSARRSGLFLVPSFFPFMDHPSQFSSQHFYLIGKAFAACFRAFFHVLEIRPPSEAVLPPEEVSFKDGIEGQAPVPDRSVGNVPVFPPSLGSPDGIHRTGFVGQFLRLRPIGPGLDSLPFLVLFIKLFEVHYPNF